MGLAAAKLLHHRQLGGGKEDKNVYKGDSDDEWESCMTNANLSLIEATKKGDLARVIQLVHAGETTKSCHNICARMASARGLVDVMQFLFQGQKADTKARSKHGWTPLKLARLYQNEEAMVYLIHTLKIPDEREEEFEDDKSNYSMQPGMPTNSSYGNSSHLPQQSRGSGSTDFMMETVFPTLVTAASNTASTAAETIALNLPRISQVLSNAQIHLSTTTLPACVQQAKTVQRWLAARINLSGLPTTVNSQSTVTPTTPKEELGSYIEYIERALKQQKEEEEAREQATKLGNASQTTSSSSTSTQSDTFLSGQSLVLIDNHFSLLTQKEKLKLEGFLSDLKRFVKHQTNETNRPDIQELNHELNQLPKFQQQTQQTNAFLSEGHFPSSSTDAYLHRASISPSQPPRGFNFLNQFTLRSPLDVAPISDHSTSSDAPPPDPSASTRPHRISFSSNSATHSREHSSSQLETVEFSSQHPSQPSSPAHGDRTPNRPTSRNRPREATHRTPPKFPPTSSVNHSASASRSVSTSPIHLSDEDDETPSDSLSNSPQHSPRLHHRSHGHQPSSAIQPTLKPISKANGRHRQRFQTPTQHRTFDQLKKEEDEIKPNSNMTFVSSSSTDTESKNSGNEKKVKEDLKSNALSVETTFASPTSAPSASPQFSTPTASPLISPEPSSIILSNSTDIPMAPSLIVTGSGSDIPIPPPLEGVPCAPPFGAPCAPPLAPGFTTSTTTNQTKRQSKLKPSVQLKALHWDVISDSPTENDTLWSELAKDTSDSTMDLSTAEHAPQLEALFARKAASTTVSSSNSTHGKAVKKAQPASTVIDSKRSNNIEIAIRRFKLSWNQIKRAILEVDLEVLTMEHIEALVNNCIPTPAEIKQLQSAVESLKKNGAMIEPLLADKSSTASVEVNHGYVAFNYAENFFLTLSSIPRYSTRLKLLLFKLKFPSQVTEIETSLAKITAVAKEIKDSKQVKQLMNVVLIIGNYLNTGTHKGSASGFRLTSLQLLETTKSNDGKTSLLDYIVSYVDDRFVFAVNKKKKSPTSSDQESENETDTETTEATYEPTQASTIPSFLAALSGVREVSLIDLPHIEREVQRMESNLKLVQIQLAHAPSLSSSITLTTPTEEDAVQDQFQAVMSDFYTSSLTRVTALSSTLAQALSLSNELIRYFGEDSTKMDVTLFFETFARFLDSYKKAELKSREKRERDARQKMREENKKKANDAIVKEKRMNNETTKPTIDTTSTDQTIDASDLIHLPAPTSVPLTCDSSTVEVDGDLTEPFDSVSAAATPSSTLRDRKPHSESVPFIGF